MPYNERLAKTSEFTFGIQIIKSLLRKSQSEKNSALARDTKRKIQTLIFIYIFVSGGGRIHFMFLAIFINSVMPLFLWLVSYFCSLAHLIFSSYGLPQVIFGCQGSLRRTSSKLLLSKSYFKLSSHLSSNEMRNKVPPW